MANCDIPMPGPNGARFFCRTLCRRQKFPASHIGFHRLESHVLIQQLIVFSEFFYLIYTIERCEIVRNGP
jgi:hypothetical protein